MSIAEDWEARIGTPSLHFVHATIPVAGWLGFGMLLSAMFSKKLPKSSPSIQA
jgi:hypothetical protein